MSGEKVDPRAFGFDRPTYTIAEACKLLNISRRSLYSEMGSGRLRRTKIGPGPKRVILLAMDLAFYLNDMRNNSHRS